MCFPDDNITSPSALLVRKNDLKNLLGLDCSRLMHWRKSSIFLVILAASILALFGAWQFSTEFKHNLLVQEAENDALRWANVVGDRNKDIEKELHSGEISQRTKDILKFVSEAGGVFRYKLFDHRGVIIHATRPEDVGQKNTKPYFDNLVRKGQTFAKIETDENFGESRSVVSEAYVPIMSVGEFRGAVEVYVDVTPKALRLDRASRAIFYSTVILLLGMAMSWALFVWRDLVGRDTAVNELSRRDAELTEQNRRFNAALHAIPAGLCMYDENRKLVVCNENFGKMYGVDPALLQPGMTMGEVMKQRIANGLFAGETPDEYLKERRKWVAASGPGSMTEQLNDGRTIEITRQPMEGSGWLSIHEDISDRIHSQKELQDRERQFRDLVEGSLQGVYIAQNWELQFANQSLADIFGYTDPEELMAIKDSSALFAPGERERIQGYKKARDKGESAPEVYECDGIKKDGTIIVMELRIRRVEWNGGTATQCVILDITDRKKAENELIRHRDRLQDMVDAATEELALKAEELKDALAKEKELNEQQRHFISVASHEFRTPMTVIDGSVQRIMRRKDIITPGELEERVQKIRGAVKTMTTLMESTLSAARLDTGKASIDVVPCNLKGIIDETAARQQEVASSHTIQLDISDLPDRIMGDATALEQVFTNLLSNAVKYSPSQPEILVSGRQDGDDVVLSVSDRGLGIDEHELPQMFSRFFRASTASGIPGTGIGLNLVKTLVELHGGSIVVVSIKGEGSTFTVRLPVAGPEAVTPETDQAAETVIQEAV